MGYLRWATVACFVILADVLQPPSGTAARSVPSVVQRDSDSAQGLTALAQSRVSSSMAPAHSDLAGAVRSAGILASSVDLS
jgi:hypothetical protein